MPLLSSPARVAQAVIQSAALLLCSCDDSNPLFDLDGDGFDSDQMEGGMD